MARTLCKPWEHRLSRRQWLGGASAAGVTALGLNAFALPAVASAMKQKHRQVLFVWIDGAMSQFESWDPKPNTQFGGPFRAIGTSVPGIHVSELLPRTARQMHHLAIVRSMSTKDNAHSSGVPRIQRGDPKNRGVVYPYFGSAVVKLLGGGSSGLPPYVSIKPGSGGFINGDAGFLGPQYGAVAFGDGKPPENLLRNSAISVEDDLARNELRAAVDRQYAARRNPQSTEANSFVFDMSLELMKRRDLFDPATVPARDVDRYGTHEFGRHMLQARRMLEAGVRFVKVSSLDWDTHQDNFNGHQSRMPKLDQGLAAMIEDLAERGMLDHVLVVVMSEFGRTPRINGSVGRDHYPEAWSLAVGGCGMRRGIVVGKTDALGVEVATQPYDIGHMFHTWFTALGIDPARTEYDNHGQPLPIAHDECGKVAELLA